MAAASSSPAYVELHARSAFSFLRGASLPEELARTACASGRRHARTVAAVWPVLT